jgi:hypothetical protein
VIGYQVSRSHGFNEVLSVIGYQVSRSHA